MYLRGRYKGGNSDLCRPTKRLLVFMCVFHGKDHTLQYFKMNPLVSKTGNTKVIIDYVNIVSC